MDEVVVDCEMQQRRKNQGYAVLKDILLNATILPLGHSTLIKVALLGLDNYDDIKPHLYCYRHVILLF